MSVPSARILTIVSRDLSVGKHGYLVMEGEIIVLVTSLNQWR